MSAPPSIIDTTHGVVRGAEPDRFTHRNMLDAERFAEFLSAHPPYVSIRDSLAGKGDSLTIDDATLAGADAARLARQFGHEVTLFVNGWNVESGRPYFFARLSHALDTATAERVTFDGVEYALGSHAGKGRFRVAVKKRLARIGPEEERQSFVTEIARLIGGDEDGVPPHMRSLTLAELRDLHAIGVELQNHGWTHARVGALPPDDHEADIGRGRQWLRDSLGIEADIFAVPNGDGLPTWLTSPNYSLWLLLEDGWELGELGTGVWNRRTIDL